MTVNVPITINLDGIDVLLGSIGKGSGNTTIQDPIVNEVTVAVADPNATTVLDGVQATDSGSINVYGRAGRQLVTILANQLEARNLAEYLVRPAPEYWFSSIEVLLNAIPAGVRDAVAELEIGDQIRVSKRFPNVANPVVQELFVEGIEHDVGVDRHVVRLYCAPASLYRCFVLNASDLDNDEYGLAGAGAVCSLNTFSTTNADSVTIIDVAGEPYWVADWKASGSVTFDQATNVEYLVVAGGGGGGSRLGGGGGAGGMRTGSVTVGAQAYTVTVGAGGAGGTAANRGASGSASVFGSLVSTVGGGGGGGNASVPARNGLAGGSGGGGAASITPNTGTGGAGTTGEGNAGGTTPGTSADSTSAGGGGKGAVGAAGGDNTGSGTFGDGGAGEASNISGSSLTYAAGGGGSGIGTGRNGSGVSGVSGNGNQTGTGGAGTDGRGGGGGGAGFSGATSFNGGKGGDGRVIVRWRVYAN